MIARNMPANNVTNAYDACVGRWQTCDWSTEFGPLKLNLNGLRSTQLERLGHATSGFESKEWRNAASWVREIEAAAARAEDLAAKALDALEQNDLHGSIGLIEQACELERRWHSKPVWQLLEHAIRDEIIQHSS